MGRFSSEELYQLRNKLPIDWVIEQLLEIPVKRVEGRFRFLCPICHEFQTGTYSNSNLSRCFICKRNFNTIEMAMVAKATSFMKSVKFLLTAKDTLKETAGNFSLTRSPSN